MALRIVLFFTALTALAALNACGIDASEDRNPPASEKQIQIQVYSFPSSAEFDHIVDDDDIISDSAKLIRTLDDSEVSEFLQAFQNSIDNRDHRDIVLCFEPNIGVLMKKGGHLEKSLSVCLLCKKIFVVNHQLDKGYYIYLSEKDELFKYFERMD
jgi:hypothetical protein